MTALLLARAGSKRPRQSDLKRAISTAYYALHHALAREAADLLVGKGVSRSTDAWVQVHRSLEHGFAKDIGMTVWRVVGGFALAAIVAVPVSDLSSSDVTAIAQSVSFPIVTQGAREIFRSYALFRRTLSIPDLFAEGNSPKHMEFLFDRFGYLRARWMPTGDGAGWSDVGLLVEQIVQLNQEPEILPPPGDHVH